MMAARPVVHVGYHKTATTRLQENLFPLAVSHTMIPRPIIKEVLLKPPGLTFDPELARERLLRAAGELPPLRLRAFQTGRRRCCIRTRQFDRPGFEWCAN